jgi:hypothetical protein
MKVREISDGTRIAVSNEEKSVLDSIQDFSFMETYNEREQYIIENLVKKSLVIKIPRNTNTVIVKND